MEPKQILRFPKITEIQRDFGLNNIIAFRECLKDQSITEPDEEEIGYSDILTVRKLQGALRQYFHAKRIMDKKPAQMMYPHELEAKLKDLFELREREGILFGSFYRDIYKVARFLSVKVGLELKRIVDIDYSPELKEFCENRWKKDIERL